MEHFNGVPLHPYPEEGVVVQNDDPDGLHRCKIRIPGFIELTDWARPFGTAGGGSPQRGGHVVPDVGADVVVLFMGGDIERPMYISGGWGVRPATGSEMPKPALDDKPSAHLVQSFQFGQLVIAIDERPGQRKLSLEDNVSGDAIVWDLEKQGLRINMASAILLEASGIVRVAGATVVVQDRHVQTAGKPI